MQSSPWLQQQPKATAPQNYRTLDPVSKPKRFLGRSSLPGPVFWESTLCGFLVFFTTLSAHSFLLYYHLLFVVALTSTSAASLVYVLVALQRSWISLPKRYGTFGTVLPAASLVALFFGTLLGPCCYLMYGRPATTYRVARMYTGVEPWQPAAAVADAGRVVFADDSRLDVSHAAGYYGDDGRIYCVAPITKGNTTRNVEFWAVGADCCAVEGGSFDCDAASKGSARGGAVVLDHKGLFQGGGDHQRRLFDSARRKAEALWGLANSTDTLYLRWADTATLEQLPQDYERKAWIFITVASALYALVAGVVVFKTLSPYAKGR